MPRGGWRSLEPETPLDPGTRIAPGRSPGQASAITSEDLQGISFEGQPREIRIDSLFGQPVETLNLNSIPRQVFADISRAVCDLGHRYGVTSANVSADYEPKRVTIDVHGVGKDVIIQVPKLTISISYR
jgi:hypothetical protein